MLTQKESTWDSDPEISYKTVFASFLSILYLKNMDQMKYGSFIKKMAEDFATGQENVYLIHIKDAQHVLSIHKNTIKLIMISTRSKEVIATNIAHHQRTKTVQPLGMYPI